MANEVKWIKISTDIFDDEAFQMIDDLPERDAIELIWFKLLVFAGKKNNHGLFLYKDTMAFTDEMLASIFHRPVNTVRLAMETFERFHMIETIEGVYSIPKWDIYQNLEGFDKAKEQNRIRQQKFRNRQKTLIVDRLGETCAYCGKPAGTIDHIVPRSKGGSDEDFNVVSCCKSCNSGKKDKDLVDFLNDSLKNGMEGINVELVNSNPKLMRYVSWDEEKERYCNVTLRYPSSSLSSSKSTSLSFSEEIKEIIDYINQVCSKHYTYKNSSYNEKIRARLKDGYTVEDFKTVIDKKFTTWHGTEFEKYLTPDTLFRPGKFETYLNETVVVEKTKGEKQLDATMSALNEFLTKG